MMERKEIPVVLCFNKTDIASHPEIAELKEVYTGCGYPVIFTSAKEEENISADEVPLFKQRDRE